MTYRNIISNSVLHESVITAWCHQKNIFLNSLYEVGTLQVFTSTSLVPGNVRPTSGIILWHSSITSFLKAALFMGLVIGLKVGHSREAECGQQLAYSASDEQYSILYCYTV